VQVLEKISPSGPCVPGLGFVALMLLIPVIGFLVIRNIFLASSRDENYWILVGLHLAIITIFLSLA
jgi:hypothetical protein